MQNTLPMLLGAALVAVGVLAAALADRIRGHRISRDVTPRDRASKNPSVPAHLSRASIPIIKTGVGGTLGAVPRNRPPKGKGAGDDASDDVIAALVTAGYKKQVAADATWACTADERSTVERWTTAALRRCAHGGMAS